MLDQAQTIMSAKQVVGQMRQVEKLWLQAKINDSTLHPIVWLLFSGLLALAWLIQPETNDSPIAISFLMFLRFVLIFILGGSMWGRVATGAVIGVILFFALMGAESLSVLMWDVPLSKLSTKLVQHADWIANALYLLGLLGLVACGAVTYVLRHKKLHMSRRYVQLSLQVLATVQIALVIELAYIGFWSTIELDSQKSAIMKLTTNVEP
jgi:hypothetical protein